MKGIKEPRIYTKPLRKLTPKTSLGYMFNEFCEDVDEPNLPWQEWLSIHALEIIGNFPDNWSFRYRYIIVLVSRQNGKTHWFKKLGLFFNYVLQAPLVIGTAQNLDLANDTFEEAVSLIEDTPMLYAEFEKALRGAGKREYILKNGERWKVIATNRRGRGWSSDLILMDEIREQRDFEGWSAISKTMIARPKAILIAVSNAGDATSVLLRHLRLQGHEQCGDPDGIAAAKTSLGQDDIDDSLGLFEWSAEPGCQIDDMNAWAQANPSLGYGFLTEKALKSAMLTDPEDIFRTECLCQWVESLLPEPFPEGAWQNCLDVKSSIAPESDLYFGIDMSQDRRWVSIGVCGMREDGNYHIEVAARRVGSEWAVDWFRERAFKNNMKLAFQGRGAPVCGLAEQICTLDGVTRCAVEGADLTTGWGRFWDSIAASAPVKDGEEARGGVKTFHLTQPILDTPAKTCQLRNIGGGVELPDRTKSPDDISPLMACAMAFAAATRVTQGDKKVYQSSYASGSTLMFV